MIEKILPVAIALLFLTGVTMPDRETIDPETIVKQSTTPTPKIDPPQPKDLTWNQQQKVFDYGSAAMINQCVEQPQNLWCSEVRLSEKTLTPWQIMNISLNTKSKFRYVSDVVDIWRVFSSDVMSGNIWRGDCDDLTSTTLDMLIRDGHPRSKVWFVLVNVNNTRTLDHIVGMIEDIDGHFWIVGDTSSQNAYPLDQLKYRVVAVANGSDVKKWIDPRDTKIFPENVMQNNPVVSEPLGLS